MRKFLYVYHLLILSFYLGLYGEHIALWETGSKQPEYVFPYCISSFPETDRAALEEGIPICDRADLSRLLEDYFS